MKVRIQTAMTGMLTAILLTGGFIVSEAGVNQRQKHQQKRIRQGMRSGELTMNEAKKLEKEQARIRRHEIRAKSDGVFTPKERAKLKREQDRASADIYKEKHDNQDRN